MFNMALLSDWRNWLRVTIMLLIGFFAVHTLSGAFSNSNDEDE